MIRGETKHQAQWNYKKNTQLHHKREPTKLRALWLRCLQHYETESVEPIFVTDFSPVERFRLAQLCRCSDFSSLEGQAVIQSSRRIIGCLVLSIGSEHPKAATICYNWVACCIDTSWYIANQGQPGLGMRTWYVSFLLLPSNVVVIQRRSEISFHCKPRLVFSKTLVSMICAIRRREMLRESCQGVPKLWRAMQAFSSEVETRGKRHKHWKSDAPTCLMVWHAVWYDAKMLAAVSYIAMAEVSEMAWRVRERRGQSAKSNTCRSLQDVSCVLDHWALNHLFTYLSDQ